MNEEHKPHNINYTFHIQSAEDFYNQLRAFHIEDYSLEQKIDLDDLSLAQEMLRNIGIAV